MVSNPPTQAPGNIAAQRGQATEIDIGNVGPGNSSGITFQGGEAGSNLYRGSAANLQTDGSLTTGGYLRAHAFPSANAILLGLDILASADAAALSFGPSNGDAVLVRTAVGTLAVKNQLVSDLQTGAAAVTTARAGGAAAALPAAPVKYIAFRDDTGARVFVPAYS